MMPLKSVLFFLATAVFCGVMLFSCNDEFNDPNPKGNGQFQEDSIAPVVSLISPLENALYADSTFVRMNIEDSVNLKSISIEIAALDAIVAPFKYSRQGIGKAHAIDTLYRPNLSDTTSFQMLIQASDSTGNVLAKTVNFKMH